MYFYIRKDATTKLYQHKLLYIRKKEKENNKKVKKIFVANSLTKIRYKFETNLNDLDVQCMTRNMKSLIQK